MGCISRRAASFSLLSWEASFSGGQPRAQGGGHALLRNAPGSLPAEQSGASCRVPLKVVSTPPPLLLIVMGRWRDPGLLVCDENGKNKCKPYASLDPILLGFFENVLQTAGIFF